MFIPVLPVFDVIDAELITEKLLDSKHYKALLFITLKGDLNPKEYLTSLRALMENEFFALEEERRSGDYGE